MAKAKTAGGRKPAVKKAAGRRSGIARNKKQGARTAKKTVQKSAKAVRRNAKKRGAKAQARKQGAQLAAAKKKAD